MEPTSATPVTASAALVRYNVTDAQIAETKIKFSSLSADTWKGYEEVRLAIGQLRETRVAIEKRRVELKADALAYGRLVDSEAKRFTNLLLEIEEPLKTKKSVREKLAAERRAEEERQRVQREALRAEENRVLAERVKAERAEFERQAKIRAEAEAVEKVEHERIEKARRDAELAALLPDVEKLAAFVSAIRALKPPKVKARAIALLLASAASDLAATASGLESAALQFQPVRTVEATAS